MSGSSAGRYLKALKCVCEPPTLLFLRKLVAAQQTFFPYESVSKLLFASRGQIRTATFAEYLEGQKSFGFGGTCIAQNAHFCALLAELGFSATLVAVHTNGREDHASVVVLLDGDAWHIDLGLMSTFTGPLPLRGDAIEKSEGYRIMRYSPANDGANYRREIVKDGEVRRLIESKSGPRTLESFAPAVERSFAPDAIFMKTLAVYKVEGGAELSIWNREYHVTSSGRTTTRILLDVHDLRSVLNADMALPEIPVEDAVRIMRERNGVDIFSSSVK